ncbi:hypothetical protein ELY33_15580 [Vreelandella andesensis]|uniref:Uncharacterized protein n=1 Tax=Vreelandella andesensis TaxID=447567 RepID=A0A3S0W3Q1_9GAMM|nr:hypothetical protein [Halomonas andesensis]RUR27320.1 hypothetical protein ELY33_15580 [Halomonas andesensis]
MVRISRTAFTHYLHAIRAQLRAVKPRTFNARNHRGMPFGFIVKIIGRWQFFRLVNFETVSFFTIQDIAYGWVGYPHRFRNFPLRFASPEKTLGSSVRHPTSHEA